MNDATVEKEPVLPLVSDLAPVPDFSVDKAPYGSPFTAVITAKYEEAYLTADETRQVIRALSECLGDDA